MGTFPFPLDDFGDGRFASRGMQQFRSNNHFKKSKRFCADFRGPPELSTLGRDHRQSSLSLKPERRSQLNILPETTLQRGVVVRLATIILYIWDSPAAPWLYDRVYDLAGVEGRH